MSKIVPWIIALTACAAAFHFRNLSSKNQAELERLRAELQASQSKAGEDLEASKKRLADLESLRGSELKELLKLRDQARQTRNQAQELARTQQELESLKSRPAPSEATASTTATKPVAPAVFSRDQWTFAGYQSPDSALVSAIWAMKEGNPATYFQSLTPSEQENISKQWADKSQSDIAAKHQSDVSRITGLQILERQVSSENEMVLSVDIQGTGRIEKVSMQKIGDEWRFGGFIRK